MQREFSVETSHSIGNKNKDTTDTNKDKAPGKRRRDSIYPFEGRPKESVVVDDDEDVDDLRDRLRALEETTGRIEEMLARLCSDIGSPSNGENATVALSGNGTLQDLHGSGMADIDT